MTSDALKTLLHPFEQATLRVEPGQRVLFLGAAGGGSLGAVFGHAELTCVQGFRPAFLALQKAGLRVVPEVEGDGYHMALVLCGRHRGQNEAWIAEALSRTGAGGIVVIAGGKTDGIASLRKRLAAAMPIAGQASKHHGLVFWVERGAGSDEYISGTSAGKPAGIMVDLVATPGEEALRARFETASGMFSHEHADPGSRLLAQCLPSGLKGTAADFCAGWGYLTVELARRAPAVGSVDLYEADHAALAAARRNVAALAPGVTSRFFWQDLAGEPVSGRYDLIVMNPPFHTGRVAEPALGESLIRVASRALRTGGELFLVANRQLPYEHALAPAFSSVEKLREEAGFKIFRARR